MVAVVLVSKEVEIAKEVDIDLFLSGEIRDVMVCLSTNGNDPGKKGTCMTISPRNCLV